MQDADGFGMRKSECRDWKRAVKGELNGESRNGMMMFTACKYLPSTATLSMQFGRKVPLWNYRVGARLSMLADTKGCWRTALCNMIAKTCLC